MTEPSLALSHLSIQRCVLDFALRDQNRWEELRALFEPQAAMRLCWYSGPVEGFLRASMAIAENGQPGPKHLMGVPRIDIEGRHAVAETDVSITVRMPIAGAEFDVTSWTRFHDLLAWRDGRWRIGQRTVVYERDRADAVRPADAAKFPQPDADLPPQCKHLAMLLRQVGKPLVPDAVMAGSAAQARLADEGRRWLAGAREGSPA